MDNKAARAILIACVAISLLNQAIIRYTWLQVTTGCSSELANWLTWFHRLRTVSMGALFFQMVYAWFIYSYMSRTTTWMRRGHVLISLINLVLMSTQMGNKDLLQQAWGSCTETFDDAYGETDACQAIAILAYVVASLVGHALRKRAKAVAVYPPSAPPLPPPVVERRQPTGLVRGTWRL